MPRARVTSLVADIRPGAGTPSVKAWVIDVGGGGFGFEIDAAPPWKVGAVVEFTIKTSNFAGDGRHDIHGRAEIVNITPHATRYRIGLRAMNCSVRQIRKLAARLVREGKAGMIHVPPDDDERAILAGRLSLSMRNDIASIGALREVCMRRVVALDPAGALLVAKIAGTGARISGCSPEIREKLSSYGVCINCQTYDSCSDK